MKGIVRTNASVAWLILVALTVVSWMLGTQHGLGGANHVPASLVIVLVAVFKVRLVGLYFMELRDAPWALRGIFEAYCAALLLLLSMMYLFA
nr:cytochrome C oxidase subunit IV family protein [Mycobacterium avium]